MNPFLKSGNEQKFERVLADNLSLTWTHSNSYGSGAILKDDYILDRANQSQTRLITQALLHIKAQSQK